MIDRAQLSRELAVFGLAADEIALARLDEYAARLVETNQKFNLTAVTEPSAIVTRHFADSATLLTAVTPPQGASLLDVGSGAGFPGLVVAILRPDLAVTLLDATGKKVAFLAETAAALGLTVTTLHARAEEAAVLPQYRERFDFATARAVAELRLLGEYALGFVKVGGALVAMKGRLTSEETQAAAHCLTVMGAKEEARRVLTLADGSERTLLTLRKVSQTPTGYPRPSAKMAKKPL
ncbi:MAG: 16S rRNA (guanine(527)-N(7))-methyltransferase RsmG [Clostridia bacterium]|nr:16S rRNA (guanine(527)-N(7))-methyltransferase RsmG [Clostridia bacterium]